MHFTPRQQKSENECSMIRPDNCDRYSEPHTKKDELS